LVSSPEKSNISMGLLKDAKKRGLINNKLQDVSHTQSPNLYSKCSTPSKSRLKPIKAVHESEYLHVYLNSVQVPEATGYRKMKKNMRDSAKLQL